MKRNGLNDPVVDSKSRIFDWIPSEEPSGRFFGLDRNLDGFEGIYLKRDIKYRSFL